MMDYAALPPEINSVRMYTGPGSESLVAAAAAWDGLATELRSTATSYSSVISGLTSEWVGPSSTSMAAAAAPYASWLNAIAAQAEQTAGQARAAAAAYDEAFAAMVPPTVIAANRAQLELLTETNTFGQNTAAIAATEAQYARMWAQDATAMYGYAGQSATAASVSPFAPPAQNTNPAGAANQTAAAAQSVGTAVGTNTQSALSQLTSSTPVALQALAAPAAAAAPTTPLTALTNFLNALNSSQLATIASNVELVPKLILPANDVLISVIMGLVIGARRLGDLTVGLKAAASSAGSAGASAAVAAPAVSAGVGQANLVGGLAVPPSWAVATPAIRTVAAALSGTVDGAVPAALPGEGPLLGEAALAGMCGGALAAALPYAVNRGSGAAANKGGKNGSGQPPDELNSVMAELAEKPDSVQHWHTDAEHLDGLLAELRLKPGFHAVHVAADGAPKITPSQPV